MQLFEEYKVSRMGFSYAKKSNDRPAAKVAEEGSRKEGHGRCFNCGKKGYERGDCPDRDRGRKCFNCQGYGHLSARCPERGGDSPMQAIAHVNRIEDRGSNEEVNRADGHVNRIKACPRARTGASGSRNCKTVTIEGTTMQCLIDSGSDCNVMTKDAYKELSLAKMQGTPGQLCIAGYA